MARHLVVFLNRPGGQSQFSAPLEAQIAAANGNAPNRFAPLHDWIAENVAGDLRVERLAEQVGMSPRTFARVYAAKMGVTPARMVEKIRIEAVRRSLEESDMPIKQIAARLRLRPGRTAAPRLRAPSRHDAGGIPPAFLERPTQKRSHWFHLDLVMPGYQGALDYVEGFASFMSRRNAIASFSCITPL